MTKNQVAGELAQMARDPALTERARFVLGLAKDMLRASDEPCEQRINQKGSPPGETEPRHSMSGSDAPTEGTSAKDAGSLFAQQDLGNQIYALLVRRGYAQHEAHLIASGPGCTSDCVQKGYPEIDCPAHGQRTSGERRFVPSDDIRDLACCNQFVRESASEFCATCGYTNLDHLRKRSSSRTNLQTSEKP